MSRGRGKETRGALLEALAEAELLYQLAAACNEAVEIDALADLVLVALEGGAPGARAAIQILEDHGMRIVARPGLGAAERAAIEARSPGPRDPIDAAVDGRGPRHVRSVPLVFGGALIGALVLCREDAAPDLRIASAIATHVAPALGRLRREAELAALHRKERERHLEAVEATRAREEILSTVSHDLRTPLGTITMGASALLEALDPTDPRSARITSIAERIQRQAGRMSRLVDDLVDFAGIEAGRVAITRLPHDPAALLTTTSDLFQSLAKERGLTFAAAAGEELPFVPCDAERVVQIFGNLVGNALKVTPRGGSIAIGATAAADDVVFFVRDTGPGIAAEELPSLFQRHWRSKAAPYKGAGLGLSIARGLVEAHGGRIWAESALGHGSTFFFSLTAPQN